MSHAKCFKLDSVPKNFFDAHPYLLLSAAYDLDIVPTTIQAWNEADQYPSKMLGWPLMVKRQMKN